MTTMAEVREAEHLNRKRRKDAQRHLRIDDAKATDREREIYARALTADDFDAVLADGEINSMFSRRILSFEVPK